VSRPDSVYICTAAVNAPAARALAAELRAAGIVVRSTWHDVDGVEEARITEHALSDEVKRRIAARCLREIRVSRRMIVLGHADMRGGLFEAGYAMALGLDVEWRGPSPTLFSTVAEGWGA